MSEQNEFVPVLEARELKEGSMKLVNVEGTPVLLVKASGRIFAVDNRCPHMGCGFSGGSLDGKVIVCPCHEWRFNLETGEYEKEKEIKLVFYKWKIKAGKICVNVENDVNSGF